MINESTHTSRRLGLRLVSHARALLAVSALAASAVTHRASAQTPQPIDLGHLGGGSATALAGADGYVVGMSRTSSGDTHAFVWSASTQTMLDITALIPGGAYSGATSVNSRGEVVGGAWNSDFSSMTGFYWSQATGVRLLGATYPNFQQTPLLINENGVVAGITADGRLFRWTLAGGAQDLGVLPGPYSYPGITAINARGDIVGNLPSGGGAQRAYFVGGTSTTVTLLSSPVFPSQWWAPKRWGNISINGINDNGIAVGSMSMGEFDFTGSGAWVGASFPFKWDSSTPPTANNLVLLGTLSSTPTTIQLVNTSIPDVPVTPSYSVNIQLGQNDAGSANAINNNGVIVGWSNTSSGYDAFTYQGSGPLTALQRMPGANWSQASSINNDGVITGYSDNVGASATVWTNGVPKNIVPSFAPNYPGVTVRGNLLWGNGYDGNWNTHAWTMGLVAAPPLPTQTLTILGGSGNVGDVAANVEYYNPATGSWQPAYLANYAPYGHPVTHPWGNVAGTNHWVNYKTDGASDPGASGSNTLWYLYRVRFTVPADAVEAKMTFSLKADNRAQVAINGVSTGPTIVGQANQLNADAVFAQNVHPGENTITLNVGDEGGLNGFNFRIDLSVKSAQPLEIVPVDPDTAPPVITGPGNLTREATGPSGAVVTFSATAVDDVDGPVAVVASPTSGSTFAIGSTPVGLAASDAAGNTATGSFMVTVRDTIAPVVSVPGNITAEATSASGATVSYAAPTATDAVGVTSLTSSPASGSTFALGNTTVTATARDAAGNTGTGSFTVTVRDTTAPALTVPSSQTLEATSAAGAVATFTASATDAVGVTSLTYSKASGSTFALGTTTVTVTAKDAAGNTSTGSFTITVRDTTAPVITSLSTNAPTLWPPNHKMVAVTVSAAAADLVGVASLKIVSATSNEPDNGLGDGDTANDIAITGALTLNLRAERGGSGNGRLYTITVEAKDAAGNASTKTVTVSVPKSQGGK